MATARKTKRKLSDIDFSREDSHIALVSKKQGGPASGADYKLVLKSNKFSEEYVQKMQQVRVTMELPDFLERFFNLYGEQADILAYMMGYVEPAETQAMEQAEAEEEYQDWIKSKMEAFEILKSAHEADSLAEVLSALDETEYLAMLNDQERIEKAFVKLEKATKESAPAASAEGTDTSPASEVNIEEVSASVNKQELEKAKMEDEVKVETVEKAQFELVQKALDEQKVQLQKALETIAQFEAEKKEAINKAKTEKVKAIVKDESKVEAIAKAALSLESEDDFTAFLAAMQAMMTTVETSEMFVEKGASTQEETVVKESAVAKLLKAKQLTK